MWKSLTINGAVQVLKWTCDFLWFFNSFHFLCLSIQPPVSLLYYLVCSMVMLSFIKWKTDPRLSHSLIALHGHLSMMSTPARPWKTYSQSRHLSPKHNWDQFKILMRVFVSKSEALPCVKWYSLSSEYPYCCDNHGVICDRLICGHSIVWLISHKKLSTTSCDVTPCDMWSNHLHKCTTYGQVCH